MCNISVMILYIQSKLCPSCLFPVCFHVMLLFIYLLFDPCSLFLSGLNCDCTHEKSSVPECSRMSKKWFFACDVVDVRLSSAHCKTNQCYHNELKCNHIQKCRTRNCKCGSIITLKRFRGKKYFFLISENININILTQFHSG